MITERESRQFAQTWFDAWNRHDLDGLQALFAENAEVRSPLAARLAGNQRCVVRGKAALRLYLSALLRLWPDLRLEPINCFIGTRSVVLHFVGWAGLRVAEVIEFNDQGKIAGATSHYSRGVSARSAERDKRSDGKSRRGDSADPADDDVVNLSEARRIRRAATG